MSSISTTQEVSNDERSSEVRDLQPENIFFVHTTFEVFKPRRFSERRDEQLLNM